MEPEIQVVLVDGGQVPTYATSGAAGMDLRCLEQVELAPFERKLVRTGVSVAIPVGFEGQIRPRSGLALKHGLSLVNSPGTIDSDYRGELGVIMINLGQNVVLLESGERIAQLVVTPVAHATIRIVASLDQTDRADGGFGSTGTK